MKLIDKTKIVSINGVFQDMTIQEVIELLQNNKIEFGITMQPDDVINPTKTWFKSKDKKIKTE